ncbi:hypothetical protein BAUCODRAFT_146479 [Baudoinia panamericana UAMH 10762]|uniref:C4-dicarboxylate transporter/malic acid transport protein n=1 Tax=Baudoinia panamericana (strain UAMH 10762) TaxID=717646 RepID=M2NFU4_BAUPA|nr:uncharacterized protein BAUCODRAFT_146479 [Baudoinia panamericana UAMH 10762]EMC97870.1 hypothetical protein BAUCODRAFT_146479 [Baudoinia panamericana UAMH 10762]
MELPFRRRNPADVDGDEEKAHQLPSPQNVSLRERFKHFTWAWFTLPMSTGGIALLLASTPHRFTGLTTIGKIFYIFDLVIFVCLVAGIIARFTLAPGSLQKSLLHPTEALFVPTAFLAVLNILACIQEYGVPASGPWLVVTLRVLFWLYMAVTFCLAVMQYWYLFTAPKRLTIQSMTPAWILPIFPVMLTGTLASLIAANQPPSARLSIIVAGVTFQGLGLMVSMIMYPIYLTRLMQYGLPASNLRPGMFIAVGPPSFTGLAFIGMANALPSGYGYFATRPMAIEILQTVALFMAIVLWSLSFWFIALAIVSVLAATKSTKFHLVWWAFVFPNVGFTICTGNIGRQLGSQGIMWVASAMAIVLVTMWFFVFISHVRAVLTKEIMMPGKDEDKDQYKWDDEQHNIPTPP